MELPPFVRAERDAIIAEVYETFAGVSREGGVSWSESWEIDMYIPDKAAWENNREAARSKDCDTNWTQVAEDSEWQGETGIGGWNFLDPVGYRYYLPVQMVHCLRSDEDLGTFGVVSAFSLPNENERSRDSMLGQWSLLDERQRCCVKRFLQYMSVADGGIHYGSDWEGALNNYWKDIPDEEVPTAPRP